MKKSSQELMAEYFKYLIVVSLRFNLDYFVYFIFKVVKYF